MYAHPLRTLTLATMLAVGAPAVRADEPLEPVASYEVETSTRTLHGCPVKHVITSPQSWEFVTAWLDGAPPQPDFERDVVVLVVADVGGGAESWIDGVLRREDGSCEVHLMRREPPGSRQGQPRLKAFFLVMPAVPGGVHLKHRTELGEGLGFVERPDPASPRDLDVTRLPQLGADIRLSYEMADGTPPPDEVLVRRETYYPRHRLPGQVQERPFPRAGIGLRFPAVGAGVRHVLAAYDAERRSDNALEIKELPPIGGDGSPRIIAHRFRLERLEERSGR